MPISLGPEDPDGRYRDGRQQRGGCVRRRALEREVAHLAFDGSRGVARASWWEALGCHFDQQTG
jgi:hypothetical protein